MGKSRHSRAEVKKMHRYARFNRKTPPEDAYKFTRRVNSGCSFKKRYASKAEAKKAIRRMIELDGTKSGDYYRCDICSGWHITSHPRRKAKR